MKKSIALFSAFLSLAALASLTGCGSGSSSDNPTVFATPVNEGNSRSIHVVWTPLKSQESDYKLVEYHIFRHNSDLPNPPALVGVTNASTVAFDDTGNTDDLSYNGTISMAGISYLDLQLTKPLALTPGNYTYRVEAIYSAPNPTANAFDATPTAFAKIDSVATTDTIHFE